MRCRHMSQMQSTLAHLGGYILDMKTLYVRSCRSTHFCCNHACRLGPIATDLPAAGASPFAGRASLHPRSCIRGLRYGPSFRRTATLARCALPCSNCKTSRSTPKTAPSKRSCRGEAAVRLLSAAIKAQRRAGGVRGGCHHAVAIRENGAAVTCRRYTAPAGELQVLPDNIVTCMHNAPANPIRLCRYLRPCWP